MEMQEHHIAVLAGDYSGPEMMKAGLAVLAAVSAGTDFKYRLHEYPFGGQGIDQGGDPLPAATLAGCRQADAILLSAIGGPRYDGATATPEQGLLRLRQALGLFANLRPTQVTPALAPLSPVKEVADVDLVIVRELTAGIYFGRPRQEGDQQSLDTATYTRAEVARILRVGFELACQRRHHVTIVDKANVLATSRLWRRVAAELAPQYPTVKVDYRYVDATAMQLINHPQAFDVIITANLFGDILSDEAAVLPGSLGVIPSASLGLTGPNLYEPIHGSAPDLVGQNKVNPLSMINSVAWMLRQSFGRADLAARIDQACQAVLTAGIYTADLGGTATTTEVTQAIVDALTAQAE